MKLTEKWDMWCVCFYERPAHTNPSLKVYTRAPDPNAAVRRALDTQDSFRPHVNYHRLTVEGAEWKAEEEVCNPWNAEELP